MSKDYIENLREYLTSIPTTENIKFLEVASRYYAEGGTVNIIRNFDKMFFDALIEISDATDPSILESIMPKKYKTGLITLYLIRIKELGLIDHLKHLLNGASIVITAMLDDPFANEEALRLYKTPSEDITTEVLNDLGITYSNDAYMDEIGVRIATRYCPIHSYIHLRAGARIENLQKIFEIFHDIDLNSILKVNKHELLSEEHSLDDLFSPKYDLSRETEALEFIKKNSEYHISFSLIQGMLRALVAKNDGSFRSYVEKLDFLISKGLKLESAKGLDLISPLHLAALSSYSEIVKVIAERAPSLITSKIHNQRYSPLWVSANLSWESTLTFLSLGAPVDDGTSSALYEAIVSAKQPIATEFLRRGDYNPNFGLEPGNNIFNNILFCVRGAKIFVDTIIGRPGFAIEGIEEYFIKLSKEPDFFGTHAVTFHDNMKTLGKRVLSKENLERIIHSLDYLRSDLVCMEYLDFANEKFPGIFNNHLAELFARILSGDHDNQVKFDAVEFSGNRIDKDLLPKELLHDITDSLIRIGEDPLALEFMVFADKKFTPRYEEIIAEKFYHSMLYFHPVKTKVEIVESAAKFVNKDLLGSEAISLIARHLLELGLDEYALDFMLYLSKNGDHLFDKRIAETYITLINSRNFASHSEELQEFLLRAEEFDGQTGHVLSSAYSMMSARHELAFPDLRIFKAKFSALNKIIEERITIDQLKSISEFDFEMYRAAEDRFKPTNFSVVEGKYATIIQANQVLKDVQISIAGIHQSINALNSSKFKADVKSRAKEQITTLLAKITEHLQSIEESSLEYLEVNEIKQEILENLKPIFVKLDKGGFRSAKCFNAIKEEAKLLESHKEEAEKVFRSISSESEIEFSEDGLRQYSVLVSKKQKPKLRESLKEKMGYTSVSTKSLEFYTKMVSCAVKMCDPKKYSFIKYALNMGVDGHFIVCFLEKMGIANYQDLMDKVFLPSDHGSIATSAAKIAEYRLTKMLEAVEEDEEDEDRGFADDETANLAESPDVIFVESLPEKLNKLETLVKIFNKSKIKTIEEISKLIDELGVDFSFEHTESGFLIKGPGGYTTGGHRPHGGKDGVDPGAISDLKDFLVRFGIGEKYLNSSKGLRPKPASGDDSDDSTESASSTSEHDDSSSSHNLSSAIDFWASLEREGDSAASLTYAEEMQLVGIAREAGGGGGFGGGASASSSSHHLPFLGDSAD